jgi:hypothetical protein
VDQQCQHQEYQHKRQLASRTITCSNHGVSFLLPPRPPSPPSEDSEQKVSPDCESSYIACFGRIAHCITRSLQS